MAALMELAITAIFFFLVLFAYFQFVGPGLDSLLGTNASPGTTG